MEFRRIGAEQQSFKGVRAVEAGWQHSSELNLRAIASVLDYIF